jgi:protein-tyrosine phosphatase
VTLLSAREEGEAVGAAVRSAGMDWTWIPLANGRPPQGRQNAPIAEALPRISAELDRGRSVLIHCSAGMHRTGMIAYALLRFRGVEVDRALDLIEGTRPHTRHALKQAQIVWGEALIARVNRGADYSR